MSIQNGRRTVLYVLFNTASNNSNKVTTTLYRAFL